MDLAVSTGHLKHLKHTFKTFKTHYFVNHTLSPIKLRNKNFFSLFFCFLVASNYIFIVVSCKHLIINWQVLLCTEVMLMKYGNEWNNIWKKCTFNSQNCYYGKKDKWFFSNVLTCSTNSPLVGQRLLSWSTL